jgi:hypothetical protein
VTEFTCKYCSKAYRKESTLAAHLCEQKRRWQQETETGVQFGLRSYLRFYETTQGSARLKSYADFVASPYYTAFVKFGRYCVGIKAINFASFVDWLLKNNKKLDYWCRDSLYEEWLHDYVKKEAVQDALERGLRTMEEYANGDSGLASFSHYFKYGNPNRICHHITTGRISAWIVYNCASGIEFLESLDEGLLAVVLPWIDPDDWNRRLQDYLADTEWCKHVLREAGL